MVQELLRVRVAEPSFDCRCDILDTPDVDNLESGQNCDMQHPGPTDEISSVWSDVFTCPAVSLGLAGTEHRPNGTGTFRRLSEGPKRKAW